MKIEPTSKPKVEANPPAGEYTGEWSGYIVKFKAGSDVWSIETKTGVRGKTSVYVTVYETGEVLIRS